MSKIPYGKPPLIYSDQIAQLKSRGLIIPDEQKAIHLLKKLSYYRLSGYWYTLLKNPKKLHKFKAGSTIEQAFRLYCFDRELRLLMLNQIEKIEVSVRAVIAYECSHSWGTFWLSDKDNFKSFSEHTRALNKIFSEVKRSKELFVTEYNKNYVEELPPSWITLEVCSFNSLSWIFKLIKSGKTKIIIANKFGLNEKVFESWLHTLVYVRNVCAHHSRLWNKNLSIKPEVPFKTSHDWINEYQLLDTRTGLKRHIKNRTYFIVCMIKYLLFEINPKNNFKDKLDDLFVKYPEVDKEALGYTPNWDKQPLWK